MTARPQKRQSVQHLRPVQPLRPGGWTEINTVQRPIISPSNPSMSRSNFPVRSASARSGWFHVGQIATEILDDLRTSLGNPDHDAPGTAHTQENVLSMDGLDGGNNGGRKV